MTMWNYRVIRTIDSYEVEPFYGIHEAYYTERSNLPISATEDIVGVGGGSVAELRETLTKMLKALDEPVLEWHGEKLREVVP